MDELARIAQIQADLSRLSDLVHVDPKGCLEPLSDLLSEVSRWDNKQAFVWATHIACQALRGTDQVHDALRLAEHGCAIADQFAPELAANLWLERGTALRLTNDIGAACEVLAYALERFRASADDSGEAWCMIELGVLHRYIGRLGTSRLLLHAALIAAEAAGNGPAIRRSSREAAVTLRFDGKSDQAVEVLRQLVEMEPAGGHGLANTLKELAASENETSRIDDAQRHYREASELYDRLDDPLGVANVARALGNIAAQLSRYDEALMHLDTACQAYRTLNYAAMEANALRDRSLVYLALKRSSEATSDAVRAWRLYVRSADPVGESGALRAVAQIAERIGRRPLMWRALRRAERLDRQHNVKLSIGNTQLHIASMGSDRPAEALTAAQQATELYRSMSLDIGVLQALSFVALRALETGDRKAALKAAAEASEVLAHAKAAFRAGKDRADFGFTAAQATARIDAVLNTLDDPSARTISVDLALNDGPLATMWLRRRPRSARFDPAVTDAIARAQASPRTPARSSAIRRLANALGSLNGGQERLDVASEWRRFLNADETLLVVGAPHDGRRLPLVMISCDRREGCYRTVALNDEIVREIDRLGKPNAASLCDLDHLWDPVEFEQWQSGLGAALLDDEILDRLQVAGHGTLYLAPHPSVSHIPYEALMVAGVPLGATIPILRVPHRTTPARTVGQRTAVGYADPAVSTLLEQREFPASPMPASEFSQAIGPDQLIWVCAHGGAEIDLDNKITDSGGTLVLDAADILARDLTGSSVLLETCWSGRSFGQTHGEALSITTALLLAGASEVVASLFPLPISQSSTGLIAASTLRWLQLGIPAQEALCQARREYLNTASGSIQIAGADLELRSDAPLAWAGLVAFA